MEMFSQYLMNEISVSYSYNTLTKVT